MMGGLGLNQLGPHNQCPHPNQPDTNPDSKTSIDLKQYFFLFESGKYHCNTRKMSSIIQQNHCNLKKVNFGRNRKMKTRDNEKTNFHP